MLLSIFNVQKKKICLLGSYGVGKTSLVARFVQSMFADKYHTTVGVKIDKKILALDGKEVTLMLWDMAGEEDGAPVKLNQVKDASGYLLVADGTRARTFEIARDIQQRVVSEIGDRPFLMLVNKADLRDAWEIPDTTWDDLKSAGWTILETSAKSGQHVEEAFLSLTSRMLAAKSGGEDEED
ncbi:MAG TPA: Rab family GTPase [Bryobacteraceae bacterium]|nr:Rab family GTPase [Bryobacteraceae bacterium]